MKLAIISHTEHYKKSNDTIVGWGPTISELNHLLDIFDEIYHVAMLHKGKPPKSALPYSSDKITFVPIPVVGGKGISDKLQIVRRAPQIVKIVNNTLKKVDCFQLRTPTGIGVFLIPYLTLCVKKPGWYKYAGNWNQKNPPTGYAIQRGLLRVQKRKVTINGHWSNQPKHHISFENPCLAIEDISEGERLRNNRKRPQNWTVCFVGRLEKEKGVERIIKAILNLERSYKINTVHLVGEGKDIDYFKELSTGSSVNFEFHGGLSRSEVFNIYKTSDAFILPTSASEGFPKVIAEAMNFGCIPVVSDISAIGHYIEDHKNGIVLKNVNVKSLEKALSQLLNINAEDYSNFLSNMHDVAIKFTFPNYNSRIVQEIINQF